MNSDFTVLQSLVPDVLKIFRHRYLVLEQVALSAPVGRRMVAQRLGMSERNVRTETDYLKDLGLIEVRSYGMILTQKGEITLKQATSLIGRVFNASQTELRLARKLGIDRAIVVPGNSDRQNRIFDLMGEQLNAALDLLLPLGQNVITVLGGKTIALTVEHLSAKLSRNRKLLFVPGRGALGQSSINLQSDSIVQTMAMRAGGDYKSLNLPEQVSSDAYHELVRDPVIAGLLTDISRSDAVIHGIGVAGEMARRRGFDSIALSRLRQKRAVVECFGYFFDEKGQVVEKIPRIGLQLEDLNKIPHVFAIASGAHKAAAIRGYMYNAPSQTWLITDEGASNAILKGK